MLDPIGATPTLLHHTSRRAGATKHHPVVSAADSGDSYRRPAPTEQGRNWLNGLARMVLEIPVGIVNTHLGQTRDGFVKSLNDKFLSDKASPLLRWPVRAILTNRRYSSFDQVIPEVNVFKWLGMDKK